MYTSIVLATHIHRIKTCVEVTVFDLPYRNNNMDNDDVFVFTSESVGEGHPGDLVISLA